MFLAVFFKGRKSKAGCCLGAGLPVQRVQSQAPSWLLTLGTRLRRLTSTASDCVQAPRQACALGSLSEIGSGRRGCPEFTHLCVQPHS